MLNRHTWLRGRRAEIIDGLELQSVARKFDQ
jgi:hypothetical protein